MVCGRGQLVRGGWLSYLSNHPKSGGIMELCKGRRYTTHEAICHENGDCPLCKAMVEICDLESRVEDLEEEIVNLIAEADQ